MSNILHSLSNEPNTGRNTGLMSDRCVRGQVLKELVSSFCASEQSKESTRRVQTPINLFSFCGAFSDFRLSSI